MSVNDDSGDELSLGNDTLSDGAAPAAGAYDAAPDADADDAAPVGQWLRLSRVF